MNNDSKRKIIRRILRHSKVFSAEYLQSLDYATLLDIQERCFISLIIVHKYKNRHKRNDQKQEATIRPHSDHQ
jgi:hypothetical protein